MRVALCYHGIAKGHNFKNGGLPVGFEHEFDLMTENLIKYNKDCSFDIFLHSWSLDYEKEVISKMKPKEYIFEPSKRFKKPSFLKLVKEKIKKSLGRGYEVNRINNIYSRWYSYKRVCDLVQQSNEMYDLVIVTRFDMCLLSPLDLSLIKADKFYSGDWITFYDGDNEILEENFDVKNLKLKEVSKGFPHDREGLQDFFFISSQEYMLESFGTIFDSLKTLIRRFGPSNHLIAKGKLELDGMLPKHQRVLTYSKDYFLSRWL